MPGLRLEPGAAKGEGKWILRYVSPVTGKRRDMGLGRYPAVGVSAAGKKGAAARDLIADGRDPIDERVFERGARQAAAQALSFEQAARAVHAEQKPGWRNAKHIDQWINTLRDYVFPKIGARKVADLKPGDFADVYRSALGNASERFTVETDVTLVPFSDLKLSYRRIVPETSPDEHQMLAMWHFYF